jgi:hypothetical protein
MQLHLINTEEKKFAKFEGMDVLTFYFDLSFFLSLSKGKNGRGLAIFRMEDIHNDN